MEDRRKRIEEIDWRETKSLCPSLRFWNHGLVIHLHSLQDMQEALQAIHQHAQEEKPIHCAYILVYDESLDQMLKNDSGQQASELKPAERAAIIDKCFTSLPSVNARGERVYVPLPQVLHISIEEYDPEKIADYVNDFFSTSIRRV